MNFSINRRGIYSGKGIENRNKSITMTQEDSYRFKSYPIDGRDQFYLIQHPAISPE